MGKKLRLHTFLAHRQVSTEEFNHLSCMVFKSDHENWDKKREGIYREEKIFGKDKFDFFVSVKTSPQANYCSCTFQGSS